MDSYTTSPEESRSDAASRPRNSLFGIGLAVLLATATFFSGLHMGSGMRFEASLGSLLSSPTTQADNSIDLTEFWEVWHLLSEKFVTSSSTDIITSKEKVYGAIDGLVRSYGDPYTIFLPPEEANMFADEIAGNFSGVGMEVGMRDDMVTVIAPLPESPAEKAGVLAGDVIIKIDGESTEGMGTDAAVRRIRGEAGTPVALTLYRKGEEEFLEISIVRDTIVIPTSKTEVHGDTFVIALYSFNAIAEQEMQQALREYVRSGAKNLILDLRGNPGGYLESAVSIASYFLPIGKVVVREHYGDNIPETLHRSFGKELGAYAPKKMVVLVDGGSASASEILAGALKEHGRATVIGTTTFGKGSVQELVELKDGSSLKVTIAHWLTPNGNSISGSGITPDIEVERTADDRTEGRDPQLDRALEFMKE